MLTRFHKILIGLLAVQIVLSVIVLMRHEDTGELAEHPILAGFDAAKVTRLQVWGPDMKTPIDLAKQGGHWVVASSYSYPADQSKVDAVLAPLAKMTAASPIATQKGRHAQLKVADDQFARKLVITMGGKDTTIFLGSTVGSHRTAVRLGGDDRVYAADGVEVYTASTEPVAWVDAQYVKVPKDEIGKITIEHGGTKTELSPGAEASAPWTVAIDGTPLVLAAGETLDTSEIDRIIGAVSSIEMKAPGDPKHDASQPAAVVTIERKSGKTAGPPLVLEIVADGENYWVHDKSSPEAALVDKTTLAPVVEVARDKLVKTPPTPAPEAKTEPGKPASPGNPASAVKPASPPAAARQAPGGSAAAPRPHP